MSMTTLIRIDLPASDYDRALDLQRDCVARVWADPDQAFLILTEHTPAVITLGRRGQPGDILATAGALDGRGIRVRTCNRGGQATLHAPGQLVAYPIIRLGQKRRSVHGHVHQLEDAVIATLADFGIVGARKDASIGVWVGQAKIAAVGVAVDRWVSYHGVAVNVRNDLSLFDLIVPCGVPHQPVTSMGALLGAEVRIEDVADAFALHYSRMAGLSISEAMA